MHVHISLLLSPLTIQSPLSSPSLPPIHSLFTSVPLSCSSSPFSHLISPFTLLPSPLTSGAFHPPSHFPFSFFTLSPFQPPSFTPFPFLPFLPSLPLPFQRTQVTFLHKAPLTTMMLLILCDIMHENLIGRETMVAYILVSPSSLSPFLPLSFLILPIYLSFPF